MYITTSIIVFGLIFVLPANLPAASVIDVQIGSHKGYDLVVVYCDTLAEFSLTFDRVSGECKLQLLKGRISESAANKLTRLPASEILKSVSVNRQSAEIMFHVNKAVYIREYLVNGPPALLLDLSLTKKTEGWLPFELDHDSYMQKSAIAEKDGKLRLALDYVEALSSFSGSEPLMQHRAGIIRQKLGLWNEALADFIETEKLSELAADAHARQTMIYLAKGDTLESGRAWAGYFHQNPENIIAYSREEKSDGESSFYSSRRTERFRPFKKIPRIIKAGGGKTMILGWGTLLVGLIALIGLLFGGGKSAVPRFAYSPSGYDEGKSNKTEYKFDFPEIKRVKSAAALGQNLRRYSTGSLMTSHPENSAITTQRPAAFTDQTSSRSPVKQRPEIKPAKIPTELIIESAQSGASETDIARKFNMGRDEVAMIISLARFARGGSFAGKS